MMALGTCVPIAGADEETFCGKRGPLANLNAATAELAAVLATAYRLGGGGSRLGATRAFDAGGKDDRPEPRIIPAGLVHSPGQAFQTKHEDFRKHGRHPSLRGPHV
jgi:hypothetical protein